MGSATMRASTLQARNVQLSKRVETLEAELAKAKALIVALREPIRDDHEYHNCVTEARAGR